MLPERLDNSYVQGFGVMPYQGAQPFRRRYPQAAQMRPRDIGVQGEQWRNILLDQLRVRGANFYGV